MRILKYNNNNVFPSLMNEFFNDDFGMNLFNRRHSVPSVNSVENNDSFEIDLAVPGMKKDDFTIELNDKILVISSNNSDALSESIIFFFVPYINSSLCAAISDFIFFPIARLNKSALAKLKPANF